MDAAQCQVRALLCTSCLNWNAHSTPTPPRPAPPRPSPPPLPYTLRSLECRREEVRLSALQARDMRLRPHLMLACAPELALFCGKEHTGEGSPWPVGSGGGGRSRQAILLSMVQQ